MNFAFKLKPFLIFSLCFILFTAIGTISHEYGHIIMAKAYGHSTVLHYASMNYYPAGYLNDEDHKKLLELNEKNEGIEKIDWTEDDRRESFERNKALDTKYHDEWRKGLLWIRAAGPIQTMLTGILGLFLLIYRRVEIRATGLKTLDWLAVFLSLFWLRQVFNVLHSLVREIISPDGAFFNGDEYYLSRDLGIWNGSISLATAIIGAVVASIVIFVFVPKKLRLSFIASGIIGSLIGFKLWMDILGPVLLP